jgi:hypothetical protein
MKTKLKMGLDKLVASGFLKPAFIRSIIKGIEGSLQPKPLPNPLGFAV